MNRIDDNELQAYVDGELAPADRARVAAAIGAEPALRQRAARAERLRSQLRAAFDPVLDEPVPARLSALLQPAGAQAAAPATTAATAAAHDNVVAIAARARPPSRTRWQAPAYALAASLAVLAVSLWLRPDGAPVRMQDGLLVAHGELAAGLDRALASAPVSGVAVGLSFRGADGRVCRSFTQRGATPLSGLACRSEAGWTLPVLSHAATAEQGELRQASSAMPPEVQAAVDARVQGDVFDAAQERAARDRGWR